MSGAGWWQENACVLAAGHAENGGAAVVWRRWACLVEEIYRKGAKAAKGRKGFWGLWVKGKLMRR